jgi:DNA-binding transcriptional MocR family regulator
MSPQIYQRFLAVKEEIKRLQDKLGIESKTIEQRYEELQERQQIEKERAERIKRLEEITGNRRPPPKWKV